MAQRERGAPARAGRRPRPGYDEPPAPRVDLRALRNRLQDLVEPVVNEADLDLDGLTVSPAGRRLVVRVTVDGEDGVGHDELSDVSRDISATLDHAEASGGDLTPGSYVLEVSSPGVDRPLTLPRHWRRNVGRLVSVRAGDRTFTDRVATADPVSVTFTEQGTFSFDQLGPGRVQVEFTHLAELSDEDFGEDFTDEERADNPEEDQA